MLSSKQMKGSFVFCALFYFVLISASNQRWRQLGATIKGESSMDFSGFSVSLSDDGSRLAVGAYHNSDAGDKSGHARVFELQGKSWVQLGADIDGVSEYDFSGCSVSLSADGSRLAVGAYHIVERPDMSAGFIRMFELRDGSWVPLGNVLGSSTWGDHYGQSVSLSANGSRVAIGSKYIGTHIFELQGQTWTLLGHRISSEDETDESGFSVSLSADGNRVAIGAPRSEGEGILVGRVDVYDYTAGSWVQVGQSIQGAADFDLLGYSVSLSRDGTRVAAGASWANNKAGYGRVWELRDGAWEPLGAAIIGEAEEDISGMSVSLSSDGSRLAIGAPYNDGNNKESAGHTRVFEYQAGEWMQLGYDINGEEERDLSGWAVAMSPDGRRVAIGAIVSSSGSGHTRVFELHSKVDIKLVGVDVNGEVMSS